MIRLNPNEVKKLKVGDKLKFGTLPCVWQVKEVNERFIILEGLGKCEGMTWNMFCLPTHPQWKGFKKVEGDTA